MRRKIWLLLLLIIPLFLSSCTEEDGKWEPMKWRSEVKKSSDGYYQVSPNGGTFPDFVIVSPKIPRQRV